MGQQSLQTLPRTRTTSLWYLFTTLINKICNTSKKETHSLLGMLKPMVKPGLPFRQERGCGSRGQRGGRELHLAT